MADRWIFVAIGIPIGILGFWLSWSITFPGEPMPGSWAIVAAVYGIGHCIWRTRG